jgi:UDP-2,4-diacetamido-2,4,6-trideoxy-beta-L-altropyranose hydrolase
VISEGANGGSVGVTLRPARAEDARYVWTTNNHETVRAQSIQTATIPWEEHVAWYEKRLTRSDSCLFIGLEQNEPVGVARFDIAQGEAVISIAIEPRHRGRGLGHRLIALVTEQALARPDVTVAVALIRAGNLASRRAFLGNQYREVGKTEAAGTTMLRFERAKGPPTP